MKIPALVLFISFLSSSALANQTLMMSEYAETDIQPGDSLCEMVDPTSPPNCIYLALDFKLNLTLQSEPKGLLSVRGIDPYIEDQEKTQWSAFDLEAQQGEFTSVVFSQLIAKTPNINFAHSPRIEIRFKLNWQGHSDQPGVDVQTDHKGFRILEGYMYKASAEEPFKFYLTRIQDFLDPFSMSKDLDIAKMFGHPIMMTQAPILFPELGQNNENSLDPNRALRYKFTRWVTLLSGPALEEFFNAQESPNGPAQPLQ